MMREIVASMLSRLDARRYSRRELARALTVLTAGAAAGAATVAPRIAAGQSGGTQSGSGKPTTEDYVAIRMLAERYVDAVNRLNGKDWSETFAPDGEWHLGADVHKGRATVRDAWTKIMTSIPNVYMHVYSGVVDHVDGDTASGRWYMGEYLNLPGGTQSMNHICYIDTYVRLDGAWHIKTRRFAPLYQGKPDMSGKFSKLTGI
jgi:uncharacterized protein (TIGR02246 family)